MQGMSPLFRRKENDDAPGVSANGRDENGRQALEPKPGDVPARIPTGTPGKVLLLLFPEATKLLPSTSALLFPVIMTASTRELPLI